MVNYNASYGKTKQYLFTNIEVEAIRNALTEYYQQNKNLTPNSPHVKRIIAAVKALKAQFINDINLWR